MALTQLEEEHVSSKEVATCASVLKKKNNIFFIMTYYQCWYGI